MNFLHSHDNFVFDDSLVQSVCCYTGVIRPTTIWNHELLAIWCECKLCGSTLDADGDIFQVITRHRVAMDCFIQHSYKYRWCPHSRQHLQGCHTCTWVGLLDCVQQLTLVVYNMHCKFLLLLIIIASWDVTASEVGAMSTLMLSTWEPSGVCLLMYFCLISPTSRWPLVSMVRPIRSGVFSIWGFMLRWHSYPFTCIQTGGFKHRHKLDFDL